MPKATAGPSKPTPQSSRGLATDPSSPALSSLKDRAPPHLFAPMRLGFGPSLPPRPVLSAQTRPAISALKPKKKPAAAQAPSASDQEASSSDTLMPRWIIVTWQDLAQKMAGREDQAMDPANNGFAVINEDPKQTFKWVVQLFSQLLPAPMIENIASTLGQDESGTYLSHPALFTKVEKAIWREGWAGGGERDGRDIAMLSQIAELLLTHRHPGHSENRGPRMVLEWSRDLARRPNEARSIAVVLEESAVRLGMEGLATVDLDCLPGDVFIIPGGMDLEAEEGKLVVRMGI